MEQGPTERFIIQQCARGNMPLPERIANAPELYEGLQLYYMAFMDLTSCRGQGYGTEGPIRWLDINQYCCDSGIIGEQREDMLYHIQHMDNAYLEYKAKKIKASSNGNSK